MAEIDLPVVTRSVSEGLRRCASPRLRIGLLFSAVRLLPGSRAYCGDVHTNNALDTWSYSSVGLSRPDSSCNNTLRMVLPARFLDIRMNQMHTGSRTGRRLAAVVQFREIFRTGRCRSSENRGRSLDRALAGSNGRLQGGGLLEDSHWAGECPAN